MKKKKKCSVMKIGRKNTERFQYTVDEDLNQGRVKKDLGVKTDETLNFREHFTKKLKEIRLSD